MVTLPNMTPPNMVDSPNTPPPSIVRERAPDAKRAAFNSLKHGWPRVFKDVLGNLPQADLVWHVVKCCGLMATTNHGALREIVDACI